MSLVTELRGIWVVAVEALVTGLVIGSAPPGGVVLLPYLVVLSLIAGITRGLVGLTIVLLAELATVLALPMLFAEVEGLQARSEVFAPWLLTSLGAGLLGAWLREIGKAPVPASDPSYESARRLLTQLRTVARRLSAGLDPVSLASQMLATVHETTGDQRLRRLRPGGRWSPHPVELPRGGRERTPRTRSSPSSAGAGPRWFPATPRSRDRTRRRAGSPPSRSAWGRG